MMARWARVLRVLGTARHWIGDEIVSDRVCRVEIASRDDGVSLFRYDATGECVADTWHESMDDALRQAKFEYELEWEDDLAS